MAAFSYVEWVLCVVELFGQLLQHIRHHLFVAG